MHDAVLEKIKAHAAREFPREACGLILGGHGNAQVIECENLSPNPEQSFLIDPLLQVQYQGLITAVYHSHPNGSAEPSAGDIASAERCNLPFFILSYPAGQMHVYKPRGILPAPYEGREFVYGVLDCLNLVSDYCWHELGIDLNDGDRKKWGWWEDVGNMDAFINGFLAAGFQRVERPQINDVVIMQLRGAVCPNHAAIYMGDSRILHHPGASCLSRLEMFGQYWRQSLVCYLRHVSQLSDGVAV